MWTARLLVGALALTLLEVTPARPSPSAAPMSAVERAYRTDIIFLKAMAPERALALYERVIAKRGESVIVRGRAPGSVVVRDTPARLARFRALLIALDRRGAGEERIFVRPVLHLSPSALGALVERVFDADGWPAVVLVPDDRSGLLVVRATEGVYRTVDKLIRRLDRPAPDRGRGARRL